MLTKPNQRGNRRYFGGVVFNNRRIDHFCGLLG